MPLSCLPKSPSGRVNEGVERVSDKSGTAYSIRWDKSNDGPPDWGSVSDCYASSNFTTDGGQIGFSAGYYHIFVDNLTVETKNAGSWTNAIVEHVETFTINGSGQALDTPIHDAAGFRRFSRRRTSSGRRGVGGWRRRGRPGNGRRFRGSLRRAC